MSKIIKFPQSTDEKIDEAVALARADQCTDAVTMLVKLVDNDVAEAYGFLGYIYEHGCEDFPKDIDKAIFYYEKSIDDYGDLESVLGLARIYYFGMHGDPDYEKAFHFYSMAEDNDEPLAYLNLGRMYLNGHGVDMSVQKAKEYFVKTVDSGYPYGYVFLAIYYGKTGKIVRSLLYRILALMKTLPISIRNPEDRRLRAY